MDTDNIENLDSLKRSVLLSATAAAAEYCALLEHAREMTKEEFVKQAARMLPKIYLEFSDPEATDACGSVDIDGTIFPEYVDEDFYDAVRRNVECLLGPDDTYLETFEEDMKYSDTPIAASVAEGLADIFQPLYNFISIVKESDGDSLAEAFSNCREDFDIYWSQTLCNVMRPLNQIRNNNHD